MTCLKKLFLCVSILTLVLTGFIPAAHAVRLKIATLSPEGSFWMEKMQEGAKAVEEKTAGRVQIRFYPGGVMGDDRAVLRKIRINQLQGGAVVAGSLSDIFPDIQIYGLPLKFRSFEEVDAVRREMDPLILQGLEKAGFVSFGLAEGGFAYIMSQSPIESVDDLRSHKVWVPENDTIAVEGIRAFELSPIPLSIADVRAGLQTGLIDTVATSPIGAITLQWHTRVTHLTDMPFVYIYATLAVDRKAFEQISPEDQAVVRENMGRVFHDIDQQNRTDNVRAMEALQNQGIRLVRPSDEEIASWRKPAAALPDRLVASGRLSGEFMKILNARLDAFRNGK